LWEQERRETIVDAHSISVMLLLLEKETNNLRLIETNSITGTDRVGIDVFYVLTESTTIAFDRQLGYMSIVLNKLSP